MDYAGNESWNIEHVKTHRMLQVGLTLTSACLLQGEETLSQRDISKSLPEMQQWLKNRKFKAAVNTVIAARRMSNAMAATGLGGHSVVSGGAAAEKE